MKLFIMIISLISHKVKKIYTHTVMCSILFMWLTLVNGQRSSHTIDSLVYLLNKTENDSTKVVLLLSIGDEYRWKSKNDSALYYYKKSLDIGGNTTPLTLQLDANSRLAGVYNEIGSYPEALKLSLENLKMAEKIHDITHIFFIKREIMWTYGDIGDNRKSLEIAKELDSLVNAGFFDGPDKEFFRQIVYLNLGRIYKDMNQLDSALKHERLVYQGTKKDEDAQGLALATASLGELYGTLNKTDSAFYYNKLGLYYSEKSNRYDIMRSIQVNLAYLFEKTGKSDSAMAYAYSAFNEYRNLSDSEGMTNASLLLSNLYNSKKQFDSAYAYLTLYNTLKTRSLIEEKIGKVQNINLNETLHKRELEQERKEAEQQYESKMKIYILIGGLALVLFSALFLYRNNRQKQKANYKIQKAYTELKATQAQLIQSEKMASLGELTAGIAHEIQNPLNFVNNFSDVNKELLEELKDEADKGNIEEVKLIANDVIGNEEKINHHGKRADAIVKNMLQHSRSSTGVKEPIDINALADEYLRLSYHGMRAKYKTFNAEIKTDFDNSIGKINIVPQDIGRVLLNLYNNAFYSVNEKIKMKNEKYEPRFQ
jgi:two-component system, NtrC family, sensor kinase